VRIERVSLRDFLVFREASVDFSPGFNVVLSPNEGGKSSLFTGVVTALYAPSSSQKADLDALARWGSAGRFSIELEFHLRGEPLALVKDFETREQSIRRAGEAKPFVKGKGVDAFLAAHLAIPDQELFMRVCGVRHEELAGVGHGGAAAGEALEEILGGGWGDVTPAKVQKSVEARRRELLKGKNRPANEENRGPVRRLSDEVELLERASARARLLSAERERLLRSASENEGGMARLDAEIEALGAKRERGTELAKLDREEETLRKRAAELGARTDRLRRLLDLVDGLEAAGRRFPPDLARIEGEALETIAGDLAQEALLEGGIGKSGGRAPAAPRWRAVLGTVLAAGGLFGGILWSSLSWIVFAAGAGLIAWYAAARRARSAAERDIASRLDWFTEKRSTWSRGRSCAEAKALFGEYAAWRRELDDARARLEEGTGGALADPRVVLAALDDEYGAAALGGRGLVEKRSALEPFRLDGDALIALDRRLEAAVRERSRLAAERTKLGGALASLERMDAAEIAERLESAREGLARSLRRARVLEALLEVLGEARRGMAGFLARSLPPIAGAHLSRITGGRYSSVSIDPVTMRIEVPPAAGDGAAGAAASLPPERVPPEILSQGARDQVYLSVRLALVELVSRGEPQPVFLDDPFVHFDPERRARALDVVREFARTHQVVLFTCDPRYRDAGERLIELAPGA
jgi:DNA repair exonuclease SbcCD ATPase subunit